MAGQYEKELLNHEEDHEQVGAGQHRLWQGQAAWLSGAARSKLEAPAAGRGPGKWAASIIISIIIVI